MENDINLIAVLENKWEKHDNEKLIKIVICNIDLFDVLSTYLICLN